MSKKNKLPAMTGTRETRIYQVGLNVNDSASESGLRTIEGMPIVFNSTTDIGGMFSETIAPGALDGADLRDVALFVNHDTSMIPLARSRNNNENSTMQLIPDEAGLRIRADVDPENNPTAAEVVSALERGDLDGMSFMFSVEADDWQGLDTDYPARTITRISRVYEVSVVTWPAYESTYVGVRDSEALESAKAALESAKRERAKLESVADKLALAKAKAIAGLSI